MGSLILKRANTSRLSGQWSDDDYDVLENGEVAGRIFLSPGASANRQGMWASGHNGQISPAAHGYEATRGGDGCVREVMEAGVGMPTPPLH